MTERNAATETGAEWQRTRDALDGNAAAPAPLATIEQMIEAWKRNDKDEVHELFTSKHFPVHAQLFSCDGLELVCLAVEGKNDEFVDQQFAASGLQDASVEQLLAFSQKYPDEHTYGKIVARHTSLILPGGKRAFAMLEDERDKRSLTLHEKPTVTWPTRTRFLGVRKARAAETGTAFRSWRS